MLLLTRCTPVEPNAESNYNPSGITREHDPDDAINTVKIKCKLVFVA